MINTYKVTYLNWKGRTLIEYIYTDTKEQALKDAKVIQGLVKVLDMRKVD